MLNFNMQAFHNELFHTSEVYDPRLKSLSKVTRANKTQLAALSSNLGWTDWEAQPRLLPS